MKDIKLLIALFVVVLLLLPGICIKIEADVQQESQKNSSSISAEGKSAAASEAQHGTFRLLRTSTGVVEEISAVDYICGVVAAEMPASYAIEALKAQAAAAFSYASFTKSYTQSHPAAAAAISGADISDNTAHYEAYISKDEGTAKWGSSFEKDWEKINEAVLAVKGKAVTLDGKPINAVYFDISTGATESSANVWGEEIPYLVPVPSEWDKGAARYVTTVKVSKDNFRNSTENAYSGLKLGSNPSSWLTVTGRFNSGIVSTAALGNKTVTGEAVRSLFGLASADFDVSYQSNTFTFTVRGSGHDVGMSQYGAQCLAAQGKSWEEIIHYYYTGVDITDYPWE